MSDVPVADRTEPDPSLPETEASEVAGESAARCPFPHGGGAPTAEPIAGCPVRPGAARVVRSPADLVVRRLLRIRERPQGVSAGSAYRSFQQSMLISGIRCTLTYVVFPFVLPAVGLAKGVGPIVGLVIGSVAIVCDVFTIRRFFTVDHKWRWPFSAIAGAVIGLLVVLLVQDLGHVVGDLLG